jgi:glycosyltransferase involved in cell wall biosynthesis
MAVHDGERHVGEAVRSVLDQTLRDFELLIVEDGSRDGTRAVLDGFDDARIRIVANERNLGLTPSLNVGLRESRGVYVARMDADDVSLPERLARQVAFLDAHPECAMVATWVERIAENGSALGVVRAPTGSEEIRRYLRQGNCIAHGSVLLRRDAVEEAGGYHEDMEPAEDYDLWLRLIERREVACLPEVLYRWRENPGGISASRAREQVEAARRARRRARARRADHAVALVEGGALEPPDAARWLADFACEQACRPMAEPAPMGVVPAGSRRLRRCPLWQRLVLRPRVESAARRGLVARDRERLAALLDDPADRDVP